MSGVQANNTLVLVHALWRHGERTTDKRSIYPRDPHIKETYEPYGYGQLTNVGKETMYELGNTLRKRYDKLLGECYYPGLIDAWSSNYDRTKVSLQLVLAALFKPTKHQVWNEEVMWQPIPTHHAQDHNMFVAVATQKFIALYKENYRVSEKAKMILRRYRDTFRILQIYTGVQIETVLDVFRVHDVLTTESQFGLELPEWAKPLHKGKIREIATMVAEMQMDTMELRRLSVGKMIGKIVADTEKKIQDPSSKLKVHLYSGHDITVGNILVALGLGYPHLPNYGACILMEIHKIDQDYVLKVFYREDKTREFAPLLFEDGDFMEFEALKNLANDLSPTPEESLKENSF